MSDPLSVTANVAAVLGLSIQSCCYLVGFLERIADAPAEVEYNLIWLRALHSTFSELQTLSRDARLGRCRVNLPSGFNDRLEDCKADLLEMESRIRRVSQNLNAGPLLHTWAKVKYSLKGDQWLAKFSQRLQTYQTAFTLDLMMIQIKLMIRVNSKQIDKPRTVYTVIEPVEEQCISSTNDSQLAQFLDFYAEPVAVRASTWYSIESCLGRFALWSGPVVKQRWSNRQPVYDVKSLDGELGFGFQAHIGSRKNKGISIVFVLMKFRGQLGSLSIRWNISLPQVVSRDADIFEFVRTGNLAAVKSMFSMRKATPLHTSQDGTGLLHIAVKSGSLEMVRLLLGEGADANSRDEEGRTPLHFAFSKSGNYDICRTLLERGADLGSRDITGKTPLHTFFSPTIGMVLVNHRENVDEEVMTPDSLGMTILQYAAWSSKSEPRHLVPYLKSDVYPILARDYAGRSLLHFAAQRGNIAILEYLLAQLDDVGLKALDSSGQSALHHAAQCRRTESIDLLLSKGADINAVDNKGRTVLHCAAARNNLAGIKRVIELCERRCLYAGDQDGKTPAELAYRYRAFEAAEYLNSLTDQQEDLREHLPLRCVESRIGNPGDLACRSSRKSLSSLFLVSAVLVLLWCIFRGHRR